MKFALALLVASIVALTGCSQGTTEDSIATDDCSEAVRAMNELDKSFDEATAKLNSTLPMLIVQNPNDQTDVKTPPNPAYDEILAEVTALGDERLDLIGSSPGCVFDSGEVGPPMEPDFPPEPEMGPQEPDVPGFR